MKSEFFFSECYSLSSVAVMKGFYVVGYTGAMWMNSYSSAVVTVLQREKYWSEEWELFFFWVKCSKSSTEYCLPFLRGMKHHPWSQNCQEVTWSCKAVEWQRTICMWQTYFKSPKSIHSPCLRVLMRLLRLSSLKQKAWFRVDTARF